MTTKTIKVLLKNITPAQNNPRKITKKSLELLKQSIKDFPEMLNLRPIIIDENSEIIGGNMRYRALCELGYTEAQVIKAEGLTPEQKKEFLIKDNVAFGDWNFEALGAEFDAGQLTGWGLATDYRDIEEIKTEILSEEEHRKIEKTAQDIIDAMTEKINTIAKKHPAKIKDALAVIITNGAGNQCLILSDPETADIIIELKRYADAGIRSPLDKLIGGLT